jgi:hypothetical protein
MRPDGFLRFPCPRCGKRLKAPAGSAGRGCTCPRCRTRQVVPTPAEPPVERIAAETPGALPPAPGASGPGQLPEEPDVERTAVEIPEPPAAPAPLQPGLSVAQLTPNLYHCRREDGRPLDQHDLAEVAKFLGVSRHALTYPAPGRLAGWHNGVPYRANECILLGDDDTDYRQRALASGPLPLPGPAADRTTGTAGGHDGTAGTGAGAAGQTAEPASTAAVVAGIIVCGVILLALAVVVWVFVVPALVLILSGVAQWWASLSIKERFEIYKKVQEATTKKG